jgi:hypothetical protein
MDANIFDAGDKEIDGDFSNGRSGFTPDISDFSHKERKNAKIKTVKFDRCVQDLLRVKI